MMSRRRGCAFITDTHVCVPNDSSAWLTYPRGNIYEGVSQPGAIGIPPRALTCERQLFLLHTNITVFFFCWRFASADKLRICSDALKREPSTFFEVNEQQNHEIDEGSVGAA